MRYLVKLKPLEPFFFGGDKNFGSSYGKNEANFYVKSQRLPQQTQILGMLKKIILEQNRLLKWHPYKKDNALHFAQWVKTNHNRAKILSGESKLTIDTLLYNKAVKNGNIDKISPIFFTKNDFFYQYASKIDETVLSVEENGNVKTYINGEVIDVGFKLQKNNGGDWIAKDDFEQKLFCLNSDAKIIDIVSSDIYETVTNLGNRKNGVDKHRFDIQKRDSKKEGFYKKITYQLKDDFSFAFLLDLSDKLKLENEVVQLGGENSKFLMQISEAKLDYKQLFNAIYEKEGYITLASDCYINSKSLDSNDVLFVATDDTKSFRVLEKRENRRFVGQSKTTLHLLPKGTIIKVRAGKQEEFLKNFNYPNLQKIGYNITINKEQK